MTAALQRLVASTTFYPLTVTYIGTVAIIMGFSQTWFTVGAAIIMEAVLVVLMLLLGVWQETRKIAALTEARLEELNERIDQLTQALVAAGEPVPARLYRGVR